MRIEELAAAYEGLEADASFADAEALDRYRAALLERSADQAAFIAERSSGRRLLELGAGNGRLLVSLAQSGAVQDGLGLELAASRVAFAQRWAADAGLAGLEFETADVLARDLGSDWDTVACITGAFAYFDAIEAGAAARLAERMAAALRPGGLLVLELYPHPEYRTLLAATGGEARIWHELPDDDPWRFYLSRLVLDGDVLLHEKTFVHRHTGEIDAGRREHLVLYTADALATVLRDAGFERVEAYGDWHGAPYADGELLVVCAWR